MSATVTRRRRGFTLVEVLIALVLLSLLMLVLTSALRSMGQVEARVEQRIEAADDFRLATQLLGEVLGPVDDFPKHLPLPDQGRFALGYYHQRQDFFSKKPDTPTNDPTPGDAA